jgi:hypothetical protein
MPLPEPRKSLPLSLSQRAKPSLIERAKANADIGAAWLVTTHDELLRLYQRVAVLHANLADVALDSAAKGFGTERLWRANEAARMLAEDAWTIMQEPVHMLIDPPARRSDADARR